MVALTVDTKTGRAISGPDLVSRGFLSDPDDPMIGAARDHLAQALRQPASDDHGAETTYLKTKIRDTLSRYFFQQTKRRPMILPIVLEV
jgi:ribonuclease J